MVQDEEREDRDGEEKKKKKGLKNFQKNLDFFRNKKKRKDKGKIKRSKERRIRILMKTTMS